MRDRERVDCERFGLRNPSPRAAESILQKAQSRLAERARRGLEWVG